MINSLNYPRTKDSLDSCFTDLRNRNASTGFCLTSDSVPEPASWVCKVDFDGQLIETLCGFFEKV